MRNEKTTCPICGMNLYKDGVVIRCDNIACDYNITPNNSQAEDTTDKNPGKKSLWQIIKDIWIALGVIKWVIIGVIAMMSAIGILSPTIEIPEEPPESIYNPAPPVSTSAPQTPPFTTTSQRIETPTRTTLTGITNGIGWTYIGDVREGQPHGDGRQEFGNGSWFDGEWSRGEFMDGEGMYICAETGNWFIGDYESGYWTYGVLTMYPSGAKYTGAFSQRNGRHYRHGSGRMEWPNGDWYEGGW